jgi:hypothetical protein
MHESAGVKGEWPYKGWLSRWDTGLGERDLGVSSKRVRRSALLISVIAAFSLAGCDNDVAHVAARVDSVGGGRVCITAEGTDTAYLNGCHLIRQDDAARIHVGDCISIAIPLSGDPKAPESPITVVRVLARDCKVGFPATTSAG